MRHRVIVGLAALLACGALSAFAQAAKKPALRTWTSSSGAKMEAEFVDLKYGRVVLKNASGEMIQIGLSGLAADDQALAKQLAQAGKSGQVQTEAPKPNLLPTYQTGAWAGFHSVYKHTNFEAGVNASGDLQIILLDKGKRLFKYFNVSPRYSYYETPRKRHVGRKIVEFTSFPKPTMKARELKFAGILDDNVEFEFNYAFSGNELRTWGFCKDPKDIEYPTRQGIAFRSPASHNFPDEVTHEEIHEALLGHEVTIEPMEGETVTYPYEEGVQRFVSPIDSCTIKGSVYGPRVIVLGAVTRKDAWLHPYIYRGYAPWRGYSIALTKRRQDTSSKSHCMRIAVE